MAKSRPLLWLLITAIGGLVLLVKLMMAPTAEAPGKIEIQRASANKVTEPRDELRQRLPASAPEVSPPAPGNVATVRSSTGHEENTYVLEGGAEQIQSTLGLTALHRRLESESIDASWAPFVETAIRDKMASQMSSGIKLLSVHCAATICEVQGVADSDEYNSAAYAAWTDAIGELKGVKGFELDQDIGVNEVSATGRRVFVTFYSRVGGEPVYDPSGSSAEGSAASVK